MKNDFNLRFHKLKDRILDSERAAGVVPEKVTLIAASKTQSVEKIEHAAEVGITHFGENYLQESIPKIQALRHLDLCWHFIGALQSNKTDSIAEHFTWVHTIDRFKIARRLSEQRPQHAAELNVLIQVNIDNESQKAGVSVQDLPALAKKITVLPNLKLRGLMVLPKPRAHKLEQQEIFQQVANCHKQLASEIGEHFDSLSMGMSNDLEAAIWAGATHIRIGSDLFGPRA
ncbi:MAG: YggS family pyridoxal phosphate-dependent enzyme [Arenicellaceae bacterium]|nr:YggS family pyridoxal phosphate-dependent enzyme [Arenicellaceae bacterium]